MRISPTLFALVVVATTTTTLVTFNQALPIDTVSSPKAAVSVGVSKPPSNTFVTGRNVSHEDIPKLLLESNRNWANKIKSSNQTYFSDQAKGQAPRILWFGCSDSRLSPTTILGEVPLGEIFVHRNIANVLPTDDLSSNAVLTYAVEHLKVDHIVVAGHTQCGGVKAAISAKSLGLLDMWLSYIKSVMRENQAELDKIHDAEQKNLRVTDLNVMKGVDNVASAKVVQDAWRAGRKLAVHSWVFHIETGLIRDVKHTVSNIDQVPPAYRYAEPEKPDSH
ncbi:carbonic anhydrase [Ramicandelaber brevisporus]|nr:carbonic anhydrase [Ramicandelaber brevisporus]